MLKTNSLLGASAILLATLFWGMTFAFIKVAVATLSAFNFLFWRFGIASALSLIMFWHKLRFSRVICIYGILLGIFLAGTVIFQTIGLRYTTASTASFITGLSVVLVAIFESLLNKELPSTYLIVSIVLAIFGIGFITLSNGLDINKGDTWILLCAFCFAIYIIIAGRASHIQHPFSLTFIQSLFICVVACSASLLTNTITIPENLNIWISILFCSIFASIVAFLLQLKFQKFVSSTKTAIIFSLEPVFATITASIYLNEHLSFRFFIGATMIFVATLFAEKRTKHKFIPKE